MKAKVILLAALAIVIFLLMIYVNCTKFIETREVSLPPDTIRIVDPQPTRVDTVTRFVTVRLPLAVAAAPDVDDGSKTSAVDTVAATENQDSATVVIPIERVIYEDSLQRYRAVVEGYLPRLVELELYPDRIFKPPKPKRWHVGPAIDIGYDGHRAKPFIGVTLSYSLLSF